MLVGPGLEFLEHGAQSVATLGERVAGGDRPVLNASVDESTSSGSSRTRESVREFAPVDRLSLLNRFSPASTRSWRITSAHSKPISSTALTTGHASGFSAAPADSSVIASMTSVVSVTTTPH